MEKVYITDLSSNLYSSIILPLSDAGFYFEPILRTGKSNHVKYAVAHHLKRMCTVFYDTTNHIILLGADNGDSLIPDLRYYVAGDRMSKELVNTINLAATTEYSIRNVKDAVFESVELSDGLFASLRLPQNSTYNHQQRAWKYMQETGLENIQYVIEQGKGSKQECIRIGSSYKPTSNIPASSWQWIISLYKKIENYIPTKDNIGDNVGYNNDIETTDINIPGLSGDTNSVTLASIDDKSQESRNDDEYKENLEALRDYIKSAYNVIIQHKKDRLFTSRCCLVTGTSGSSKSFTTTKTLKECGLKESVDYFITKLSDTSPKGLYNMMYSYNGKIIVIDDAANIFGGNNRIAFWKSIADTNPTPLEAPFTDSTKERTGNYYTVTSSMNRRDRFYKEAGLEYKRSDLSVDRTPKLVRVQKAIPNKFVFTGCVIIISNQSPNDNMKTVIKNGGTMDDWYAVAQRFTMINLAPSPSGLWAQIKEKILADMEDSTLNDMTRIVNSQYAQEVIDEVDRIIAENPGNFVFQWRTIIVIRDLLAPENGDMIDNIDKIWRKKLKNLMLPSLSFR